MDSYNNQNDDFNFENPNVQNGILVGFAITLLIVFIIYYFYPDSLDYIPEVAELRKAVKLAKLAELKVIKVKNNVELNLREYTAKNNQLIQDLISKGEQLAGKISELNNKVSEYNQLKTKSAADIKKLREELDRASAQLTEVTDITVRSHITNDPGLAEKIIKMRNLLFNYIERPCAHKQAHISRIMHLFDKLSENNLKGSCDSGNLKAAFKGVSGDVLYNATCRTVGGSKLCHREKRFYDIHESLIEGINLIEIIALQIQKKVCVGGKMSRIRVEKLLNQIADMACENQFWKPSVSRAIDDVIGGSVKRLIS
jgi:hypothetical protein